MKKILSITLSLLIVAMSLTMMTSAAPTLLGDVNGDGEVTSRDARWVLQYSVGILTDSDLKCPENADYDGNGEVTSRDARKTLQASVGLDTDTPSTPTDPKKAYYAKLFNEESAKMSKGTYDWTRICAFTKDVDVGSATNILNSIIKGVDENADLNSVVGGFLGVGSASGKKGDAGKYAIIAMKLTEGDIKEIKEASDQVTLILNDSKNPSNGGNTPFNHISNDFVTEDDVKNAISGVTTSIAVSECNFKYFDVSITARVDKNQKPTVLWIRYKTDASMKLKAASVNVNGTGELETTLTYTNFKY